MKTGYTMPEYVFYLKTPQRKPEYNSGIFYAVDGNCKVTQLKFEITFYLIFSFELCLIYASLSFLLV